MVGRSGCIEVVREAVVRCQLVSIRCDASVDLCPIIRRGLQQQRDSLLMLRDGVLLPAEAMKRISGPRTALCHEAQMLHLLSAGMEPSALHKRLFRAKEGDEGELAADAAFLVADTVGIDIAGLLVQALRVSGHGILERQTGPVGHQCGVKV